MKAIALALAIVVAVSSAHGQANNVPSAADGIAQYRALLADGNPAELWEAKAEALWKSQSGPKNASRMCHRTCFARSCGLSNGPFAST